MMGLDVIGILDKCGQQRFVREDIDTAHQPVGSVGDEFDGARREDVRAVVAGRAHPEHQVTFKDVARQRLHVEVMHDAILELAHVRLIQLGVQFRLSEQYYLQQLGVAGLQVIQQAKFFQRIQRHRVSLIHQHDDALAFARLLLELVLYHAHDDADPFAGGAQPEPVGDRIQHLLARQAGIGEIDGFDMPGQFLKQHAAQHGFSAADFTAHLDDALDLADGVDQRIKDLAAIGAGKKEFRDRSDSERGFGDPEVF